VNLKTLKYFVVVAEEGNMHRAAERLHIAQPALTRQIKVLENALRVELFERLPRGVQLTAAGRSYLIDARNLLELSAQANERVAMVNSGIMGSLRLGLHEVAHKYGIFRRIIETFTNNYRDIQLSFNIMSSQRQLDALLVGDIDVGFVYLWQPLPHQLQSQKLRSDQYVVAVPANNPLASKAEVRLEDLAQERFLWVDRGQNQAQSDTLMLACERCGFVPNTVHDGLTSEEAMLSLVSVGAGVAFMPATDREASGPIMFKPVSNLNVEVELHLTFRSGKQTPTLGWLLDCAAEAVAEAA